MHDYPLATVVIPCRNERLHIAVCLDSLLGGDYPHERLEILVVDGMSTDGTRDIVQSYTARYPFIKLVDNPKLTTPAAMNAGICKATGQVVAIVGAHSTYDTHYLSECVRHLYDCGADQTGAVAEYIPRENTLAGKAIAAVHTHPFGAGGGIRYKTGANAPTWVDTVSSGCYRRDVFTRVGLFNEALTHSQDIEFNLRLKRAGGKTLLVPTAVIRYHARANLKQFCRHNFRNGLWAVLPFLHAAGMPVSWRHLTPLAFVTTLLASTALAAVWAPARWLLLATVGLYFAAIGAAATQIAIKQRDGRLLLMMPVVFATLHLAYGLGSLRGLIQVAAHVLARGGMPAAANDAVRRVP